MKGQMRQVRVAPPAPSVSFRNAWITVGSLVALVAGLVCGIAVSTHHPALVSLVSAVEPLGRIWMSVLWVTVLPLLVSMLVVSVASTRSSLLAGRLGVLSTATAVSMVGAGVIVTILVARTVIAAWPIDPATVAALREPASEAAPRVAGAQPGAAAGGLLASLTPGRFIGAAADGNLMTLLAGAMLAGFLITFMPSQTQERLIHVFQWLHDGMLRIVRLILLITPFGVFSLTVGFAARAGLQAAGAMSYMLGLVGGLLLLYTLACYPLAALIGGVPMHRFARAVLPAQVFGLGTRSSVAAVPLLLDACERVLGLPLVVPRFVLPMMVSVFKVTRSVGSAKLLVLAHLYGVDIGPVQLLIFVLLETAAGSSPGLPQMGILTAPAYVASGIPLDGLLLFSAVDTVIDTPKTLLNVTGAMTASTIVARISGIRPAMSPLTSMPDPSIAPAPSAH